MSQLIFNPNKFIKIVTIIIIVEVVVKVVIIIKQDDLFRFWRKVGVNKLHPKL